MTTRAAAAEKIAGARPLFHDEDVPEILERLEKVLRGGRLIFGGNTRELEESFREYVGTRHAVSVNSCTTALQIAMRFYGVEGREVIVPTNTFASCVKAVMYEGGRPVLAGMDGKTFCLDVDDAISRITPATAGIIVVHIAGLVCPEIDRLREECRSRGLFLLEDPSHAHGAMIDDRKAGSLADAACFSFYPTKIMTTGTGGMITTDDERLAAFARSVRHHGQSEAGGLESIVNLGNDWCMDELRAVLGIYQLKRLEENVERRNQVVRWYRRELAGEGWLEMPEYPERFRHAYYKFPVLLAEGIDKAALRRLMAEDYQIEMGAVYDPPCHRHPVFREKLGCYDGQFPEAERALARQICPPVHAAVREEDVVRASAAMRDAVARLGG